MIDVAALLAFIPAALALNLTPGADMMFCLGQGLRSGRRAGRLLAANPAAGRWLSRVSAGIFAGLALRLAIMERA